MYEKGTKRWDKADTNENSNSQWKGTKRSNSNNAICHETWNNVLWFIASIKLAKRQFKKKEHYRVKQHIIGGWKKNTQSYGHTMKWTRAAFISTRTERTITHTKYHSASNTTTTWSPKWYEIIFWLFYQSHLRVLQLRFSFFFVVASYSDILFSFFIQTSLKKTSSYIPSFFLLFIRNHSVMFAKISIYKYLLGLNDLHENLAIDSAILLILCILVVDCCL